jgi:acyl-CoA thioester hydrolase
MYTTETKLRVRYAETDKMGYCYYGNYAEYFEVGRVEALRALGATYKEMEDNGVMLPVLSFSIKYFKPAFYDDLLTIKTTITELPTTRLHFIYETINENNVVLNKAETTLAFIDMKTGKPCHAPDWFMKKMNPFFTDKE